MLYRMVALVLDGLVGFPAGLSLTSLHLSPSSFHLSPRRVLVVGFPAGLSPTSFHLSPTSFHLSPSSFICLPRLWLGFPFALVLDGLVGFPAGLSPTSFHLFPTSFHLSPTSFNLSPTSFHLSPSSFHSRLACLPLPFICLPLLFTCLPVLFICLPGWVLAVGFPAVLSPASFHLSPLPSSGLLCPPNPLHLSPCVCICLPAPDCCGRLCLAILCLPALDVAGSICRVFRFRKTQTVWGLRWCNLKKEGVKEKGCVGQKKDSPFTKPRSQLARRGASPIVVALLGFHVSRHFFLRSGETAQTQGTAETLRPHADC